MKKENKKYSEKWIKIERKQKGNKKKKNIATKYAIHKILWRRIINNLTNTSSCPQDHRRSLIDQLCPPPLLSILPSLKIPRPLPNSWNLLYRQWIRFLVPFSAPPSSFCHCCLLSILCLWRMKNSCFQSSKNRSMSLKDELSWRVEASLFRIRFGFL